MKYTGMTLQTEDHRLLVQVTHQVHHQQNKVALTTIDKEEKKAQFIINVTREDERPLIRNLMKEEKKNVKIVITKQ